MSTINLDTKPHAVSVEALTNRCLATPHFGEIPNQKADEFTPDTQVSPKQAKKTLASRIQSFLAAVGRGLKAAWLPAAVSLGFIAAAVSHLFTGGLSTLLLGAGIGGSGSLAFVTGLQEALKGKKSVVKPSTSQEVS